jgi:hypothetical protein
MKVRLWLIALFGRTGEGHQVEALYETIHFELACGYAACLHGSDEGTTLANIWFAIPSSWMR